jgi:protocatechuate 3,4-dioxygenase beta subunit
MAPGRYTVSVHKTGYASPAPPNPPPFVIVDADRPTGEVMIALPRGAVIAGRVLDVNGQPRADVRVMAMRRVPGTPAGNLVPMMPPASTNDLGEFRIHSLAAGEYVVQANPNTRWLPPDGRAEPPAKRVMVSTYYPGTVDAEIAQPVALAAGQTFNGLEIGLQQVPTYSIAGVVVDQSGRPLANAGVTIATSGSRLSMAGPATRVITANDGSFKLDGLPSGTYTVNAGVPSVSGAASYTYITSNQLSVFVNEDHVTGLQLTAERP